VNSRDRIGLAINHKEADRVPVDLGGSRVSSMHVSTVYRLRQALKLDKPGTPVKVIEPVQMLGEIGNDLLDAIGGDVLGLFAPKTSFGYALENWKSWTLFDGTPVLVPECFNTDPESSGDILMYPQGDKTAPASGRMPKDGFYFDMIIRQQPVDEDALNPLDNVEEYKPVGEDALSYYAREIERLYDNSERAVLANFGGTGFGDISTIPGVALKQPKGIRDVEEWYISLFARQDYVKAMFEKQCEVGLANLEKIYKIVGEKPSIAYTSGTDFGTQNGPFLSPQTYRDLFKPFHKIINDWVHKNTNWKTFVHSCGSIWDLMDDMVDAGFEIFNPVQCSASCMDPKALKQRYGQQITFWGGGVDTQKTLPFGTPEEVREEVKRRLEIFMPGGGFVFNSVHNIQANTPIENMLAMWETVKEYGKY